MPHPASPCRIACAPACIRAYRSGTRRACRQSATKSRSCRLTTGPSTPSPTPASTASIACAACKHADKQPDQSHFVAPDGAAGKPPECTCLKPTTKGRNHSVPLHCRTKIACTRYNHSGFPTNSKKPLISCWSIAWRTLNRLTWSSYPFLVTLISICHVARVLVGQSLDVERARFFKRRSHQVGFVRVLDHLENARHHAPEDARPTPIGVEIPPEHRPLQSRLARTIAANHACRFARRNRRVAASMYGTLRRILRL